ncbi:SDR family NAD(P)-dependent oxidoreductase [Sporichthya polymorpha]|uniref:SDR family NAD(P)-dependent oxidoreductase n=1 Tax=Sporichthya polymorpha TaxID=35751 RepID=UPI00036D75DF|nr:SDR family NAD(P)-dependent oxidoreductase [Sporichthya polymorpha]
MDRRILITGAASGLGRALARAAADDGARVLLTDRDPAAGELARLELAERLRERGGNPDRVAFLALDVRDDAAWDAAREWCAQHWGGLDVLVNNAGVAAAGPISDIPMADWDWILDINLKGVIRGVRTFVPMFEAQGAGHVVNIASLAGLMNLGNMASYNVTKAGVISLSETMRCELEPLGIRTTVVCPSFFATNLADTMRTTDPAFEVMARQAIAGELFPGPKLTADDVARKVLRAVDRRKFLLLPHVETRLLYAFKRLAPTPFAKGLAAANQLVQKRFGTNPAGRPRATGRMR